MIRKSSLRFLFVTPEFPVLFTESGGLSSFMGKFTTQLAGHGHKVDVVTIGGATKRPPRDYKGVMVHSVAIPPANKSIWAKIHSKCVARIKLFDVRGYLRVANLLGRYANLLNSQNNYDVIQFSDHGAVGYYLQVRPSQLSICRLSSAPDLYFEADGSMTAKAAKCCKIQYYTVSKANLIISPSHLIANHVSKLLHREVCVSRPPAQLLCSKAECRPPKWLPRRYLLHFAGWLAKKKGSHLVIQAMRELVKKDSSAILVIVGAGDLDSLDVGFDWRELSQNMLRTGPMLPQYLYPTIAGSCAVVLPSLIDNIPNAAIEAKLLGKPLISIRGNSIDELASDDSDIYIASRSPSDLACAMHSYWCDAPEANSGVHSKWLGAEPGFQFNPAVAMSSYIELVWERLGVTSEQKGSTL